MPDLYLQFAGSLAAVALLVIGVHGLGFAREARLASEKEAREIAGHAPGASSPSPSRSTGRVAAPSFATWADAPFCSHRTGRISSSRT